MSKKVKMAFSFAHLLGRAGIGAGADQGGDDDDQADERKQGEEESDEDYAKRMEELDKKDKGNGKDDPDAEDDDDPAGADDGETEKEKAARGRERSRCAAIFGCKAAAGRPDLAAHLAFNTGMSAREAIGMLGAVAIGGAAAAAAQPREGLASRMAKVPAQNVGASGAGPKAGTPEGAAAMILAAGAKRRGEKQ